MALPYIGIEVALSGFVLRETAHFNEPLAAGSHVGRYEVVRPLAGGGMSEIYLVKNSGLHSFESLAVLKRLPPHCLVSEPNLVNMFMDEAQLTASLRHPNIAQVFDFGEDDDSYFFVMEYVEGLSLSQLQKKCRGQGKRFPLALAIQIIMEVAEALNAAHEARGPNGRPLELVHRDVSPQNVIVTGHGSVKLIDFGIARARQRREQTQTGMIKGKVAYMSPEQCRAESVDRLSDLFSLGILLYELTTGMRPQGNGRGPDMLFARAEVECPDPRSAVSGYPDGLALIVNQLLRISRAERFSSARDVYDALGHFAVSEGITLSPFSLGEWVDSLDRTLALGSGVWTENGSEVRDVTVKEKGLPRGREDETSVTQGMSPAKPRPRRAVGTQYDFDVVDEFDVVEEARVESRSDETVSDAPSAMTNQAKGNSHIALWSFAGLFMVLGFTCVFAVPGAADEIAPAIASVLSRIGF